MAYVFMLKRGTFCKHNSPFPSSPKLLHQSEAWCTTIDMKMSLICM